jgi:hypothetical protein
MDPIARLFGSFAKLKLLRLFLFNDDGAFSLADLAFRTKVAKDAVRKELTTLVAAGVIKKKPVKGVTSYITNKKFVHLSALQAFMRATTSVSDGDIVAALKKAGSLRLVVLTGLFTGAIEPKIDLLIVGDRLEDKPLDSAIHALEAELGREIRYAAFTTQDFRYRVGVYDRLVRDTFDYPHRTILDKIGM